MQPHKSHLLSTLGRRTAREQQHHAIPQAIVHVALHQNSVQVAMDNDLGQVRYEGKCNPIPPELPNTKLHRAPTAALEAEWALHFASPHHPLARLSQNKFSFQGARNDIFTCRRAVAGFGIKKFLDRSSALFGVESAGSSSVQSSQLTLMPPQLHLLRNRPKKQEEKFRRHDKKLSFRSRPTRPGTIPSTDATSYQCMVIFLINSHTGTIASHRERKTLHISRLSATCSGGVAGER